MGKHTRFLTLAAEVATDSQLETKHGSILVRGGKVLGAGHNSSRSRLAGSNVMSLHSEVRGPKRNATAVAAPSPAHPLTVLCATSHRWRLRWPYRAFYRLHGSRYYEHSGNKPLRHCDMYVVRLLPEGRQLQGSAARDPAPMFGYSQPCVRCLRALAAFGVHRVIYSTGEAPRDGEVACEVREVRELLAAAGEGGGHHSRGDKGAVASGAVRQPWCQIECQACE